MQTSRLRPQTVPELLDRAFRIYRQIFLPCVALVAVVTVPLTLINYLYSQAYTQQLEQLSRQLSYSSRYSTYTLNALQSQIYSALAVILLLSAIGFVLQTVLVNGPLTYLTSERLRGNNISITEAFSATTRQFGRLGGGLLLFLMWMLLVGIGIVFGAIFTCGLGLFIAFPLGIFIGFSLYAFLVPCIILEHLPVMQAMRRAWELAKSRFWQVFFVIFGLTLINYVISLIVTVTQGIVSPDSVIRSLNTGVRASDLMVILIQTGVSVIVTPVMSIALTLLYYDARIRMERLDLALIALNKPNGTASDVPGAPPQGSIFTNKDFTAVAILTAIFFSLIVVVYVITLLTATRLIGF